MNFSWANRFIDSPKMELILIKYIIVKQKFSFAALAIIRLFMLLFIIQSVHVFEMSGYSGSLSSLHRGNTMVNSNSSHLLPHISNHGTPDHHFPILNMPLADYKQHKIHHKWSLIQEQTEGNWKCDSSWLKMIQYRYFSASRQRLSLNKKLLCNVASVRHCRAPQCPDCEKSKDINLW